MGEKICEFCKQPVEVNKDNYEIFENMHWLCFHIVYEHHGDPDAKCNDPSCPWWHLEILRDKLNQLGIDPNEEIEKAITKRWNKNEVE